MRCVDQMSLQAYDRCRYVHRYSRASDLPNELVDDDLDELEGTFLAECRRYYRLCRKGGRNVYLVDTMGHIRARLPLNARPFSPKFYCHIWERLWADRK